MIDLIPVRKIHRVLTFSALLTFLILSTAILAQPAQKGSILSRTKTGKAAPAFEATAMQNNCVLDSEIEVINTSFGSPLTGPFKSGEQVTFRYTINEYTAADNGCQWLQGIVPVFGNGWDPLSFRANGRPKNAEDPRSQYVGNWDWYDEDSITYNWDSPYYTIYTDSISGRKKLSSHLDSNFIDSGVIAGEGMPAGWFAYSNGGSPCCETNGDPDFGWGDGAGCGPMNGWKVEFTVGVRPFTETENCNDTQTKDLSVRIFTFSDGETGCYSCSPQSNNAVCAEDVPELASFENFCCEGPEAQSQQLEICSGEEIAVVLESNADSMDNVNFFWTVEKPGSVTGASPGSGEEILQELINTGDSTAVVTYRVIALDQDGCSGIPGDIVVTVFPEIQVTAYAGGPEIEGCAEASELALGGNPTATGGNGGPYTYDWTNGLPNAPDPTITPRDSVGYSLTVTDSSGCVGLDTVTVIRLPALELEIVGDTVFCPGDTTLNLRAVPSSGIFPYQFEWNGPGGTQSGDSIIVMESGQYTVEMTDTIGCSGSQDILLIEDDCLQGATISYTRETALRIQFTVEFGKSQNIELRWEFGDGKESTMQNPVHTYTEEGSYEVLFTWWNEFSTDTVSLELEIGTTSIGEAPFSTVRLYPNPASGQLTVEGVPLGTELSILDMNGQFRYDLPTVNSSRQQLSLPDLEPGLYILTLTHEGAIERKKLIIK